MPLFDLHDGGSPLDLPQSYIDYPGGPLARVRAMTFRTFPTGFSARGRWGAGDDIDEDDTVEDDMPNQARRSSQLADELDVEPIDDAVPITAIEQLHTAPSASEQRTQDLVDISRVLERHLSAADLDEIDLYELSIALLDELVGPDRIVILGQQILPEPEPEDIVEGSELPLKTLEPVHDIPTPIMGYEPVAAHDVDLVPYIKLYRDGYPITSRHFRELSEAQRSWVQSQAGKR